MALATRCPNCGTTFRVVSDQLKLRRGLVKCGSCATVFNGIEQLRYVATLGDGPITVIREEPAAPPRSEPTAVDRPATPPTGTAPPAPTPAAPVVAPIGGAAAARPDIAPTAPAATPVPLRPAAAPAPVAVPTPTPAAAPAPSPASASPAAPAAVQPPAAPAATIPGTPPASTPPAAAAAVPPGTETAAPGPIRPAASAPATDAQPPDSTSPTASAAPAPPAAPDAAAKPPLDRAWATRAAVAYEKARATPVGGSDELGPLTLIEVERRPGTPVPRGIAENPDLVPSFMRHRDQVSRGSRIALAVAAPLLTLTLAGQALWLFHDEAAAVLPAARPALDAACARLGCVIALPRRADQLRIASADLRQTGEAGAYELRAGLRNDARWDQSWPSLDVSLTDVQGKLIARRMLAPADYLPAQPDAERLARSGLAARAEQLIVVPLRIDVGGVSGYTVDAFFP
ncbi:DUF3426 domain-containing protein [Derxia lacustris]|uniref:DUF3426 domain-containing protein n=1 Tax=Derxia lacustris TaxID=764842 RepID=UPI001C38D936|nr:DUF3426 domain-containing protein [Derxia lacustris]